MVAAFAPLVVLITACCIMGTPPPPASGEPSAAAPPAPTPGHTCSIVASVHFPPTKPSGEAWDVGGGAPDPFLIVRQDGVEVGRTDRIQDTRDASFTFDVSCDHARALDIEVLDRDLSLDDSADDFRIEATDASAPPYGAQGVVTGTIVVSRS
jgi:hypothetical protein